MAKNWKENAENKRNNLAHHLSRHGKTAVERRENYKKYSSNIIVKVADKLIPKVIYEGKKEINKNEISFKPTSKRMDAENRYLKQNCANRPKNLNYMTSSRNKSNNLNSIAIILDDIRNLRNPMIVSKSAEMIGDLYIKIVDTSNMSKDQVDALRSLVSFVIAEVFNAELKKNHAILYQIRTYIKIGKCIFSMIYKYSNHKWQPCECKWCQANDEGFNMFITKYPKIKNEFDKSELNNEMSGKTLFEVAHIAGKVPFVARYKDWYVKFVKPVDEMYEQYSNVYGFFKKDIKDKGQNHKVNYPYEKEWYYIK